MKLTFQSLYVVIVSTLTMYDASRVKEGRLPTHPGRVEVTSPENYQISVMRQF
jgi:hypothetical protein